MPISCPIWILLAITGAGASAMASSTTAQGTCKLPQGTRSYQVHVTPVPHTHNDEITMVLKVTDITEKEECTSTKLEQEGHIRTTGKA